MTIYSIVTCCAYGVRAFAFIFLWFNILFYQIMPTTSYKDPLTSINLILYMFFLSFFIQFASHCVCLHCWCVFFSLLRFVLWQQIHTDKIILFGVANIRRPNSIKKIRLNFLSFVCNNKRCSQNNIRCEKMLLLVQFHT